MANTGTHEQGDMERLVKRWRQKDWELRFAVSSALLLGPDLKPNLPTRGITRLLPVFEQRIWYSEGAPGVLLVTLILWDEPSYSGVIEVVAKHVQEASAGLLRAFNKARPRASAGKLTTCKLQVVLPPDAFLETPAEIEGVPVSWFRWVPDDEHMLHVEEIHASATEAVHISTTSPTNIERILGHLAWWKSAIESGASTERAVRQVLLVNNAGTLLEWHLTVPGNTAPACLTAPSARTAAGKLVGELLGITQEALARARKPDGTLDETKVKKSLRALPGPLQKLLEGMAGMLGISVRPERVMEFEEPLKPARLISDWLALNGTQGVPKTAAESSPKLGREVFTGPGAFVLESLLPAIAAERLADNGELSREALAAVREECAGWLEDAIEIAARESKGAERKKWRALGEPVIEAWRRGGSPGKQEAGA